MSAKKSEQIADGVRTRSGEPMEPTNPPKKSGDRLLRESESAHNDALRKLQKDVRYAEKFNELSEHAPPTADPFFYPVRKKRTGPHQVGGPSDVKTRPGLGPDVHSAVPAATENVDAEEASSEPTSTKLGAPVPVTPPPNRRSRIALLGGLVFVATVAVLIAVMSTKPAENAAPLNASPSVATASIVPQVTTSTPAASTSAAAVPAASSSMAPSAAPPMTSAMPSTTSRPSVPQTATTSVAPKQSASGPFGQPVY